MAVDDTTEEWRPIEGYLGYEVSSLGNVKSLERFITEKGGKRRLLRGRILSRCVDGTGYYAVNLGGALHITVHQLVCHAFHGPKPAADYIVAHNDGVKLNVCYSNLRWDTHSGNGMDMHAHGTCMRGTKSWHNKLSEDDVWNIRALISTGIGDRIIAGKFSVATRTIRSIRTGENWSWLK